jgi:hypothetical protein
MVRNVGALLQKVHANACLRECGVMGLEILHIPWAFWHSRSTAARVMCWLGISLNPETQASRDVIEPMRK